MNMNKLGAVAAGMLLVVGLAGCVQASEDPAPAENTETTETSEAAPLVAEQPEEKPAEEGTPEEQYLDAVREALRDDTQIPNASDEQLLAAGEDACAQIADGTLPDQVRVIEDEQPDDASYYVDSMIIGGAASRTICSD